MKNKILTADDEKNILYLYKRVFNIDNEYDILQASNGDELVKLYNESLPNSPKVIVTDKDMPSENEGLNAAKKIRSLPKGLETVIFLVSGTLTGKEKSENDKRYKDVDYTLSKPVDMFKLKEMIDEVYKK